MCLLQFVLIPSVSVYKDTPPLLIGAKTEIPCPSTQFPVTCKIKFTNTNTLQNIAILTLTLTLTYCDILVK